MFRFGLETNSVSPCNKVRRGSSLKINFMTNNERAFLNSRGLLDVAKLRVLAETCREQKLDFLLSRRPGDPTLLSSFRYYFRGIRFHMVLSSTPGKVRPGFT